jgi:hypothetical protein
MFTIIVPNLMQSRPENYCQSAYKLCRTSSNGRAGYILARERHTQKVYQMALEECFIESFLAIFIITITIMDSVRPE